MLHLMEVSRQLSARRPPVVRYAVLGIMAVIAFSYEVRLTYQNLPEWFGRSDAPARPFFAEDIGTQPITVSFLTHEAVAAGLKSGDELVALNGRPVVGTAVFGDAMRHARAGDVLRVTVQRAGELRTAAITLRSGGHRGWVGWVTLVLLVVIVPLLSLAIGFWVALVRPRDVLAWLLLIFLAAFAVFFNADAEQWGPVVRDLAVIYRFGVEAAFPIAAVLFGILFPVPFPRQRRWRWWYRLAWLLIAPTALLGLAETVSAVGTVENRNAVMGLDRVLAALGTALPNLLILACALAFFAALAVKWKLAASAEFWSAHVDALERHLDQIDQSTLTKRKTSSRRRLSLMFWSTVVGLGPLIVLQAVAGVENQQLEIYLPWWVWLPAYFLTALVPVTFAYVIVVQRAMDVRLVLRQGLQYALATGGVRALQWLIALLFGYSLYELIHNAKQNPILYVIIATLLLIGMRVRRMFEKLKVWVDRRFFRDAYNAEQILSELGDQVRTMLETRPLLDTVARRIAAALHVPRVAVLLNAGSPYQLAYVFGYDPAPNIVFSENAVTVERLKKEREPARVYFQDPNSWIYHEPQMTDQERASLAELEAELLLPLSVKDKLIGFMSLAPKRSEEPYTGSDLRLLKSVAAQTGLALEVARLTTAIGVEIAQRERLNRELEIAREVQERLFPQHLPAVPGIDYCGRCRPAREVGGDYYDFLELPKGRLGIAVGDVSGKGIGAALMMAALEASLRGQVTLGGSNLSELLAAINRLVYEASSANRYATFFYGQFDPKSHDLNYVNAGHNPPVVLRRACSQWQVMRLETGGSVIGLLRDSLYQEGSFALQPGDLLLLFTDGVSETMNPFDEEWGEERLIEAARACDAYTAAETITRIMAAADMFAAGAPQHDDMTLVALRVILDNRS